MGMQTGEGGKGRVLRETPSLRAGRQSDLRGAGFEWRRWSFRPSGRSTYREMWPRRWGRGYKTPKLSAFALALQGED